VLSHAAASSTGSACKPALHSKTTPKVINTPRTPHASRHRELKSQATSRVLPS
jgi:hypothetical protein